jgi:hypothetical protein
MVTAGDDDIGPSLSPGSHRRLHWHSQHADDVELVSVLKRWSNCMALNVKRLVSLKL